MSTDWESVRAGRPIAWVGAPVPKAPPDWAVVRLFGARPVDGPGLIRAIWSRGREQLLTEAGLIGFAADRFRGGLRRRILGEDLMLDPAWAAMEPLQHLAHHCPGRTALIVDRVDEGDDASLVRLRQVVSEADRLEFALVLGFGVRPTEGVALALLEAVEGSGTVLAAEASAPGPAPEPAPAVQPPPAEPSEPRALVEQLLHAAEEAEASGRVEYAWVRGLEALGECHALPDDEARLLEGRLRTCLGRVQATGAGAGPQFSLPAALEQLDAAVACLADGPLLLRNEARHAFALAAYELGGNQALDHGIDELMVAVRELQGTEHDLAAARLLNDLAALLVRRGDPLRAHALLEDSRCVFAERADHPVARVELAETDHLIARLPLHVEARPGMDDVAVERALSHVDRAIESYSDLGLQRQYAHGLETRARLLMRVGRDEEAVAGLMEALPIQEELGDALGLARSSAALSELLLRRGRGEEALAALIESVRMNLTKGSRGGMVANLESLAHLEASFEPEVPPSVAETIAGIRHALQQQLEAQ